MSLLCLCWKSVFTFCFTCYLCTVNTLKQIQLSIRHICCYCLFSVRLCFLKTCWMKCDRTGRMLNDFQPKLHCRDRHAIIIRCPAKWCRRPLFSTNLSQVLWSNSVNIPSCHHVKQPSIIALDLPLPFLLLIFPFITMFSNVFLIIICPKNDVCLFRLSHISIHYL